MNFSKFKTFEILSLPVQAPIKETFTFVTDVIETFNGIEERHQMRGLPKQAFDYSFLTNAKNNSEFFIQLQENIRKDWAIPIWTEVEQISKLEEGTTKIKVSEYSTDFIVGNSVFIYRYCSDKWLAFDIVTKQGSEIVLNAPIPFNISNCLLMPLKKAWIKGSVSKNTNGIVANPTAHFVMYDISPIEKRVDANFNRFPIRNIPTMLNSGETSRTVTMRQDIADFDTGVVEWRTTWKKSRYVTDLRFQMFSKSDVFQTKQLLFTDRGKYSSFWLPTYEKAFKPLNIVGNSLFCETGFIEELQPPFNICLHKGDTIVPYVVIETKVVNDQVELVVNRRITEKLLEIDNVSHLKLNRFDSDTFSFEHKAGIEVEMTTTLTETNA